MNIILLGPPGAGKGTQSDLIMAKYGYEHCSVGDALREAAKTDDEIKQLLSKGEMVSIDIVEKVFEDFLAKSSNKILLDGVPRTLEQSKMVDRVFAKLEKKIDKVIFLNLSEDKIVSRILNRWFCVEGDKKRILSGSRDEVSKECSGILERRSDDTEDVVRNRIKNYRDITEPLVSIYKDRGLLVEVDASLSKEEVFAEIERYL